MTGCSSRQEFDATIAYCSAGTRGGGHAPRPHSGGHYELPSGRRSLSSGANMLRWYQSKHAPRVFGRVADKSSTSRKPSYPGGRLSSAVQQCSVGTRGAPGLDPGRHHEPSLRQVSPSGGDPIQDNISSCRTRRLTRTSSASLFGGDNSLRWSQRDRGPQLQGASWWRGSVVTPVSTPTSPPS